MTRFDEDEIEEPRKKSSAFRFDTMGVKMPVIKQLKVLLVGDHAVGKTSICHSFTGNQNTLEYVPTTGMEVYHRRKVIPGSGKVQVDFEVWDVGGSFKKLGQFHKTMKNWYGVFKNNNEKDIRIRGNAYPLAEKIALKASQLSQEAPERFLSIYDRLSTLQMRELEPLLYILNQVHSDPTVSKALNAKRPDTAKTLAPSTPKAKRSSPPVTPGLSKSKSYSTLSGSTQFQTPRVAEIINKQRSQSNLNQTPSLLGSTLNQLSVSETDKKKPLKPVSFVEHQGDAPLVKLSSKSSIEQESLIIEDLLYVLLGIEGEYIKRTKGGHAVNPELDPSLAELINKILPICTYLTAIERFIEDHIAFEYGKCHHALAACLRQIVQEYYILVAQLEHQAHTDKRFSLQKLIYYIKPTLETFTNIYLMIENIEEQKPSRSQSILNNENILKIGGTLLSFLADRMVVLGGNTEAKKLYSHLLKETAKPYFEMIEQWVCNGVLEDPYNEFMIQQKRNLNKEILKEDYNDLYWEQRYTLDMDNIPTFLQPFKDKILTAGKYLNVLRECNQNIKEINKDELSKVQIHGLSDALKIVQGERLLKTIDLGYAISNETLLNLFRKDYHLMDRLQSMKTFFLLDQSDYVTHFLDLAYEHLNLPAKEVSITKIVSLLELVVRTPSTTCSSDPNRDDLSAELCSISLFDQLMKINSMVGIDMKKHLQNLRSGKSFDIKESLSQASPDHFAGVSGGPLLGIDAFAVTFSVSFPLSLVLNMKVMTKYQMLFRHLLKCKVLERLLGSNWLNETKLLTSKKSFSAIEKKILMHMTALRGKMLHFIHQVIFFMFFEVINPHWDQMIADLKKAVTVDELIKKHDDFLDTCLKECMLTNTKLIAIFSSLITTCHSFVKFSEYITESFTSDKMDSFTISNITIESEPHQFFTHLETLERSFMLQIQSLIDVIQVLGVAETARLASLVSQLDFNNYYAHLVPTAQFILNPVVAPVQ
ncbi:Gamma-tubulin complex component 2 [Boothiomyces sp. JEL0866]|nr:Gamma-tubulin complex component 2 [Boothiomyces sp. JEL0866]